MFGVAEPHQALGHLEYRADLLPVQLPVFQKLHVSAGDGWLLDAGPAEEEDWAIGCASLAFTIAQGGADDLALLDGWLLVGGDDDAGVAVVQHKPLHQLVHS